MSLKYRNKIAPQMVDYDQIGEKWVPYLMRSDGELKQFKSVNTDKWGLRNSIDKNGNTVTLDELDKLDAKSRIGVVVGSSAVFGVGSSNDKNTIPSILSDITEYTWLNLGGRAYNSTQELLKLIIHLPKKIDSIVIFSGVNNLTLSFLSDFTSPVFNSFYSQSTFERAMSNPPDEYIGVRKAFRRLIEELKNKLNSSHNKKNCVKSKKISYDEMLTCFERDMRVARLISTGLGIKLNFAMQPLATWIDKSLSVEEFEIFKILDEMNGDWSVLANQIGDYRYQYFNDVKLICEKYKVEFCNLNLKSEFKNDEWLFVDRVHLTDRGCELAAKILKKEFKL